jgi:hypothetical protein
METEEVGSTRTAGVPVRPSGADPVRSGGGPAEPSTAPVHQMAPGGAHRFALLLCLVKISLCGADLPTEAVVHEQIRKAFHDALDGRALRVGALEKAPFVKINRALQGNSRFSGISVGQVSAGCGRFPPALSPLLRCPPPTCPDVVALSLSLRLRPPPLPPVPDQAHLRGVQL